MENRENIRLAKTFIYHLETPKMVEIITMEILKRFCENGTLTISINGVTKPVKEFSTNELINFVLKKRKEEEDELFWNEMMENCNEDNCF